MRINTDEISLATALVAVLVVTAGAFQIGSFCAIGLQFVTFAQWDDWLLFGLGAVPLVLVVLCIFMLAQAFLTKIGWGAVVSGSGNIIFGAGVLMLCAWVLLWTSSNIFVQFAALCVILVAFFVGVSIDSALLINRVKAGRPIHLHEVARHAAALSIMSVFAGVQATNSYSKKCTLVLSDKQYVDAQYLRHVSDGHLVRIRESVHFIPNDQVKEIVCSRL